MEKHDIPAFTQNASRDEHAPLLDPPKISGNAPTGYVTLHQRFRQAPLTTKIFITFLACLAIYSYHVPLSPRRGTGPVCGLPGPYKLSKQPVRWRSCGEGIEGYDCANVTVPLDYDTWKDGSYIDYSKTVSIAVTRFKATDIQNKQGAIFLNPGGPGGSGTNHVYRRSKALSTITKGQFDLIGFDPRGINMTRPYVSCFGSALDEAVFRHSVNDFRLELPTNFSAFPGARGDIERQLKSEIAMTKSLARKCHERTGDAISYMGTQAVVRDIDFISKLIEGEDKPINFWGFSYGTAIGQYLIKLLPPSRIGRVIIDGVIDPTVWSNYPTIAHTEGILSVDDVLKSFASSCYDAKENCTLNSFEPNSVFNFTGPDALLSAIDQTLDSLYTSPVPIYNLEVPAVATSSSLRSLMFRAMYSMDSWPALADHLANAFQGNYTGIVNATMIQITADDATKPDSSTLAVDIITCADTKPYDDEVKEPTAGELADLVIDNMETYSKRMGNGFFQAATCHAWDADGLLPRKSRYSGPFDMENDVLQTPILIVSNTYDPATSLASAKFANDRLGNNARLIQQKDGWGHLSLSQISYCTAHAVRKYMVDGQVPAEKHVMCDVDQLPWQQFDNKMWGLDVDDAELRMAWVDLAQDWLEESNVL